MASDLELRAFSVGPMDNNVYILVDPETHDSVLFDAPTDAERILSQLQGTALRGILMTHTDGDHVQALEEIRQKTGAPVGVHQLDAPRLPGKPDFLIDDGQEITLGSIRVEARHTPGHSPGSVSFVADGLVIAGDTLFPGGPGNTQRPDGSFDQIIESIRGKLFVLPDDTAVYPGHGKPTTIGNERPHLQEWLNRGW